MRWIAERIAEQAFGRSGITQRRQQEVDGGARRIDGPVEVTPTPLYSKCTSHQPARICWPARDDGAAAGPIRGRNVEPNARSSCDPPPDRARRATLRHRVARASSEDTSARHTESALAPSAAT